MSVSIINDSWLKLTSFMNIYWQDQSFYELYCRILSDPTKVVLYIRNLYNNYTIQKFKRELILNDNLFQIITSIIIRKLIFSYESFMDLTIDATINNILTNKETSSTKIEHYEGFPVIYGPERLFIANYFDMDPGSIWCPYTENFPFIKCILYCASIYYKLYIDNNKLFDIDLWSCINDSLILYIFKLYNENTLNDNNVLNYMGFICDITCQKNIISCMNMDIIFEKLKNNNTDTDITVSCILDAKNFLSLFKYYNRKVLLLVNNKITFTNKYIKFNEFYNKSIELKFKNYISDIKFDNDHLKFMLLIKSHYFYENEINYLYNKYYIGFTISTIREATISYCLLFHNYTYIISLFQTVSNYLNENKGTLHISSILNRFNVKLIPIEVSEIIDLVKYLFSLSFCERLDIIPYIEVPEYAIISALFQNKISNLEALTLFLCSDTTKYIKTLILNYINIKCTDNSQLLTNNTNNLNKSIVKIFLK